MTVDLRLFSVKEFEIHATYGAHLSYTKFDPLLPTKFEDLFLRAKSALAETRTTRTCWSPTYRNSTWSLTMPVGVGKDNEPDTLWLTTPPAWKQYRFDPIKAQVSAMATVRVDGTAAITPRLVFKTSDQSRDSYGLPEVLAALSLCPRILEGIPLDGHTDESVKPPTSSEALWEAILSTTPGPENGKTHKFSHHGCDPNRGNYYRPIDNICCDKTSSMYDLFLSSLTGLQEKLTDPDGTGKKICDTTDIEWNEYCSDDHSSCDSQGHLPFPKIGDPQIPYFFVLISITSTDYEKYFTPRKDPLSPEDREILSKAIGAILERWVAPEFVPSMSIDYLNNSGITSDGHLPNRYRNSRSFVAFNESVTVCIRPTDDHKDESVTTDLNLQNATYGSILRCTEHARLRWHHAAKLSRDLDELARKASDAQDVDMINVCVEKLAQLRSDAAVHMHDPLSHLWDASVGTELSRYLQKTALGGIERECFDKLAAIKMLIVDTIDTIRLKASKRITG